MELTIRIFNKNKRIKELEKELRLRMDEKNRVVIKEKKALTVVKSRLNN